MRVAPNIRRVAVDDRHMASIGLRHVDEQVRGPVLGHGPRPTSGPVRPASRSCASPAVQQRLGRVPPRLGDVHEGVSTPPAGLGREALPRRSPRSISPPARGLGRGGGAAPPQLGCTPGRRSAVVEPPVHPPWPRGDCLRHGTRAAVRRAVRIYVLIPPSCASTSDPGRCTPARARASPEAATEGSAPVGPPGRFGSAHSAAGNPPCASRRPTFLGGAATRGLPLRRRLLRIDASSSAAGRGSLRRPRAVDEIYPAPASANGTLASLQRASSRAPSAVSPGHPAGLLDAERRALPGLARGLTVAPRSLPARISPSACPGAYYPRSLVVAVDVDITIGIRGLFCPAGPAARCPTGRAGGDGDVRAAGSSDARMRSRCRGPPRRRDRDGQERERRDRDDSSLGPRASEMRMSRRSQSESVSACARLRAGAISRTYVSPPDRAPARRGRRTARRAVAHVRGKAFSTPSVA